METLHSFFGQLNPQSKLDWHSGNLRKSENSHLWYFSTAGGERKASTPHLKEVKVDLICEQVLPTFFHPNVIFSFIPDLSPNITICFTLSQVTSAQDLGVLQGECDRQRDDGRTSHIMVRTWARDIGMVRAMKRDIVLWWEQRTRRDRVEVHEMSSDTVDQTGQKRFEQIFSIQKKWCCWIKLSKSKTVWLTFLSIHSIV